MKKILVLISIVVGFYNTSIAQTNDNVNKVESAAGGLSSSTVGDLMAQMTEGLNPKMLNKVWKKEGAEWLDKARNAADVSTLSSSLISLATTQIKEKAFKPSWEKNKDKWLKQVKEARSPLGIAALLKTLYSNLDGAAFNKDWATNGKVWAEGLAKILQ